MKDDTKCVLGLCIPYYRYVPVFKHFNLKIIQVCTDMKY